jgi:tRNA A-37 threonylcarbamoyl transferase component Bud32
MRSPNADLVARDRAIAGLAVLLDGDAFAAALREALPAAGILAAQPRYVRYKPGANCTVAYGITTAHGIVPAYARAYAASLRGKLDHARRLAERPGALGPAACVLTPLDIACYSWPYDHELPALPRLADARKRRKLLAAAAPHYPALHAAALHTLRYKPERRYVGLLEGAGGARAVVRLYAPDEYAAARRAARTTPIPTQDVGSLPATPRLLAADDATHMLLLEWLPGQTLSALLAAHPDDTAIVHAAGAALATLHQSAPPDLPPGDPPAALEPAVAAISAIAPAEAARATHLAEAIGAALRTGAAPRRLIHGDLYADQMLVHNGDLALIDFDNAALGDPAADLGAWIAHRHRVAVDPTALRRQARALLAGYGAAGGRAANIEAHSAANLLRLAAEPFRYCAPDWPAQLRRLLDCAEECLSYVPIAV